MSHIHPSPLPDVEVPEIGLADHVLRHERDMADKPALVDGPSGRTLTYGQLGGAVRSFAGGLVARGWRKGQVLAVMAPNLPEYAVVFHGTAMAGGTVTTINPTYRATEVRHQLSDAGATLLVTVGMFLDTAREAAQGTDVEEVVTIDPVEGVDQITSLMGEPLAEHVAVSPDDVVALPYSSGTTGLPKGVMLTHRNLIANVDQSIAAAQLTDDESFVAALPFFHIYGMSVLMNAGLVTGATIITMPRFDLEQFLRLNAEHGCTRAYVAPPIVLALAKQPAVDSFDLSSLQQVVSGAAPLSAEVAEAAAARLGCEVVQGYGMTELSPVSQTTPPGSYKPGTVGLTLGSTELRVVDVESGEDLGTDAEGEMWIRGPQVMAGYLNNEEATRETLVEDGWLRTGDIARVDADGHVTVTDRLKELIKYKGFQVPPAELEGLLLTHDEIADAGVIGVPDEEAGEVPVGFVVLAQGSSLTEQDVKDYVKENVASYKQLRRVELVESIPKSATGKILRRELRQLVDA